MLKASRAAAALPALVAVIMALSSTPTAVSAQPRPAALLVRGATLIDGTGRAPRPDTDVLITGGRIAAIGSRLTAPAGAEVVDARGAFVMPGIVDAHAHIDTPMVFQLTDAERETIVNHNPTALLYNGVTTVLNLSSPPEYIFPKREAQKNGTWLGPRIVACGRSLTPEGGWGSRHGGALTDGETARRAVQQLVAAGADCAKVMIEDGLGGSGTYKEISAPMLAAIVDETRRSKLPVYVHAMNRPEYIRALTLSPRAIVHGLEDPIGDDDPLLAELRAMNVAIVPTLSLIEAFFRGDDQPALLKDPVLVKSEPPFLLANLATPAYRKAEFERFGTVARIDTNAWARKALPIMRANTMRMKKAGLLLGVGTDAGGPVGYNFQGFQTPREIELLVDAGFTPMEALVAATKNGGIIAGRTDVGTLEPGKVGDLLILDADPLADITNVRRIRTVVLGGVPYPRERFAWGADTAR